jgi:hypothetical protein
MRVRGLNFIPSSINFSQLTPMQENALGEDDEEQEIDSEIDKEILLLNSLAKLNSDKERCVLLLEILREYGYQIDYESIATALGIRLRWFMRVKSSVKQKVSRITVNQ